MFHSLYRCDCSRLLFFCFLVLNRERWPNRKFEVICYDGISLRTPSSSAVYLQGRLVEEFSRDNDSVNKRASAQGIVVTLLPVVCRQYKSILLCFR